MEHEHRQYEIEREDRERALDDRARRRARHPFGSGLRVESLEHREQADGCAKNAFPRSVVHRTSSDNRLTASGNIAIAWTLTNPAVDGAIVGFRRADQVDPIVAAANLELDDEDVAEIEGSA